MDDIAACAEICEEYGFARQAALLRTVAQGGLKVFAVCERLRDQENDGLLTNEGEGGDLVALFLDRDSAERDAQRRDLLAFRTRNLYEYCGGPHIIVFSGRTPEELEQEISTILGADYRLPSPIMHEGSLFPADATDEQMLAVSRLFDGPFFYVAELEFATGANPPVCSESPS
ncbi:MAG TPA: hypothetical protein VFT74_16025 [Isosphaeraceae bacterium]|nr:hypothetical protein [Isosphaeraceae bacterium]